MAEKGNWKGGYREDGGYDGVSEYDRDGNYVGTLEDYQLGRKLWRQNRLRRSRCSEYGYQRSGK
mgnify:CR=1 FL=1